MYYKAATLAKHLQHNYKLSVNRHINSEYQEAKNDWAAPQFLFRLLIAGKLDNFLLQKDLEDFHEQYELRNKVNIDLKMLLDKQWIRFVAEDILIPEIIKKAIWYLNEEKTPPEFVTKYRQELLFLSELTDSTCSIHTAFLLDDSTVFELVDSFQQAFPKMPDLEKLLKDKILVKIPKTTQYSINRTHPIWKSFDKVLAARYWEYLINSKDYSDDAKRLIQWKRIFLMENWIFPNVQDLLADKSRERFVQAAFELVCSEKDLDYSKDEIIKWRWDRNRSLSFTDKFSESPLNIELKSDSFYQLFFIIKETAPRFINVELQSARLSMVCLIEQIVHSETQFFSDYITSFSKTRQLFSDSFNKPYLLWNLTCLLERQYPEAIAYALTEPQTAAWGMWILEQLKYQGNFENHSGRIQHQLKLKQLTSENWLQGFEIVLHHLSRLSYSNIEETDTLFDILYFITYNSSDKVLTDRLPIAQEYHNRYLKALDLLENYRIEHHYSSSSIKPFLFPYLLENLSKRIKQGKITIRRDEMIEFDVGIWQLNLLILRLCDKPLLSGEIDSRKSQELKNLSKETTKIIYNSFKREIQLKEVDTYEFLTEKQIKKEVRWWTEPMAMIYLDWSLLVLKLEENGLLRRFLNSFELDLKDNKAQAESGEDEGYNYWMDDYNHTQIKKQRIVLRMMLLMYESVIEYEHRFRIKNVNLKNILQQLETIIIDISRQNKNSYEDHEADLFYSMFESSSFSSYGENLLAHLFRIANNFEESNRKKLIELFKDSPLDRLLWIFNILGTPLERKIIEEAIKETEVSEFLEHTKWVDELRNALIQSVNSSIHVPIAEKILATRKKSFEGLVGLNPKNEQFLFEIEAIILLKKEGIKNHDRLKGLEDLPIPKSIHGATDVQKSCERFKKLVIANFYSNQNNYAEAVQILWELVKIDSNNFTYQAQLFNHRIAAQIGVDQPNISEIESAFRDFSEFEKNSKIDRNSKETHRFADTLNYYKAVRSHFLEFDVDFNFYIHKLSLPFLYDKEVLPFIIRHHVEINQDEIADYYLQEARKYYQKLSESPAWLVRLNDSFDKTDVIAKLQTNLNHILGRSPKDLVRIIPPKFKDDKETINDFILYHAIECASLLLRTKLAIKPNENRYNDVFVGYLKSRFIPWSWSIPDESHGGVSSNGKEPGERDWIVETAGTELAFFEALIFDENKRKSYVESHLKKLLGKYSATIKFGYLVVYYRKANNKFSQEWSKYKSWINDFQFSEPFVLLEKIKELPDSLKNYGTQNMKIGLSKYGDSNNPIFIYHIYLNMNYDIKSAI